MTYKSVSPAHALNSYLWKLLEVNLGWEKWNTLPLIIPVAQQPELLQTGKAFIVYGSAMHPAEHNYEFRTGAISYVVYAPTSTEANNVAQLLYDTFKRQDDAAADVNDWLDIEGLPGNRPDGHRNISFGSVHATMVEEAEPADEEGGYVSALVLITVKYIVLANTTLDTSPKTVGSQWTYTP